MNHDGGPRLGYYVGKRMVEHNRHALMEPMRRIKKLQHDLRRHGVAGMQKCDTCVWMYPIGSKHECDPAPCGGRVAPIQPAVAPTQPAREVDPGPAKRGQHSPRDDDA